MRGYCSPALFSGGSHPNILIRKNLLKCRIPQTMAFNTSKTEKNGLIFEDLGVICIPFLGNLQSAEISNSVFLGIQLELGTQNSGNAMAFLVGHLCRDGYFGEFSPSWGVGYGRSPFGDMMSHF